MIEIRRILCPIDFSDFSRRAFEHAVAIAGWYESTVTLFNVYAGIPAAAYAPGTVLPPEFLAGADRDELLASMKCFAGADGPLTVPVEYEIAGGNPAAAILAKAAAMPSDLLVMGTHGRSGFERLVLGSVTEKVRRKAACPVLSVPPRAVDVTSALPVEFGRVVCAIDFSESSMRGLDYAMSIAQEADAHLTVVHVLELPPKPPADLHEDVLEKPLTLSQYIAAAEEDRRARLREAVPDTVRAYCTVETVLATGKPYREILRIAAEQPSDLIVIGVHGRGAADLLFFGSTTQHVVREATCPVLTLRTG
jgi:nucleotide-binding universal stress UspA family protein